MEDFNSPPNIAKVCFGSTKNIATSSIIPSVTSLFKVDPELDLISTAIGNRSFVEIQKIVPNLTHLNSTQNYTFMEIKREPCQTTGSTSKLFGAYNEHDKDVPSTVGMVKVEMLSPSLRETQKYELHTNFPIPVSMPISKNEPDTNMFIPVIQPTRDLKYMGVQLPDIGEFTPIHCNNILYPTSESLVDISLQSLDKMCSTGKDSFTYCQYSDTLQQDSVLWPQSNMTQHSQYTSENFIFPYLNEQPRLQCELQSSAAQLQFWGSNCFTFSPTSSVSSIRHHHQVNNDYVNALLFDSKKTFETQNFNINIGGCSGEGNNQDGNCIKTNIIQRYGFCKDEINNETLSEINQCSPFPNSFKLSSKKDSDLFKNECEHNMEPANSFDIIQQTTNDKPICGMKTSFRNSSQKMVEMRDVNIQTDVISFNEVDSLNNQPSCNISQLGNKIESTKSITTFDQKEYSHNRTLNQQLLKPNENFISYGLNQKNDCGSGLISDSIKILCTLPSHADMSGLELLSNISTASFGDHDLHKTVRKPQEQLEEITKPDFQNNDIYNKNNFEHTQQNITGADKREMLNICSSLPQSGRPALGGLNLLCALAEQRIQEEVESNIHRGITKERDIKAKAKARTGSRSKYNSKEKCLKKSKKQTFKEQHNPPNPFSSKKKKKKKEHIIDQKSHSFKLNKWTYSKNIFKTMESDIRTRLVDITRKYKKKKRQLDEINLRKRSASEFKIANISCKNPNFICFLDKCETKSFNFPHSLKSFHGSQKIVAKNISCQTEKVIKNPNVNPDFLQKHSYHKFLFNNANKKIKLNQHRKKEKTEIVTNLLTLKPEENCSEIHTKFAIPTEIDSTLLLSNIHLYQKETRVLTDMGGLFYAGVLKPLQPPDVYSITFDGERGNKSHIMSREEIFKDTILEIAPKDVKNIPVGTRLCAYWSQQYRCLYPGKSLETGIDDFNLSLVNVEFDDGDSGKIHLQNIRFLLSDYPIVEYNQSPLNYFLTNNRLTTKKVLSKNILPIGHNVKQVHQNTAEEINSWNIDKTLKTKSQHSVELLQKKSTSNKKTKLRAIKLSYTTDNMKYPSSPVQNQIGNGNVKEQTNVDQLLKTDLEDKKNTKKLKLRTTYEGCQRKIDICCRGSKIAAFLPERQLWNWFGQAYRKTGAKGRVRKYFYKTIARGDETITVGECAVFLSTGRPDRPYIGRIEAMWETVASNKVVRVRWFYHPEETIGCPELKYPGALFVSPHEDENDVQTISHKCEVAEFSTYIQKFGLDTKQYASIYENNDIFYISGFYNPRLQALKLQQDIPIKDNNTF